MLACLEDLQGEREAAEAAAREQGQAYLQALAAGTASGRPPAAVALAAQQLRLEKAVAAEQAALAGWQPRRAAGSRVAARPPPGGPAGRRARRARARLEDLQAAAEAEAAAGGKPEEARTPRRNVTDPDSRLMPVRGGGFIQGYNCQDAAADDRLMLGGYACQDTGDALQAQRLAAGGGKRRRGRRGRPRRPRRRPRRAPRMPRPAVHPAGEGQERTRVMTSPPATTP